jgi:hypothetical protein
MEWFNASIDEHPKHGQEVLISVDGIYYMAIYDGMLKQFKTRDADSKVISSPRNSIIYWTPLDSPDVTDL